MPRIARSLSFALLALLALAPPARAYETPLDAHWSDGFALPVPSRRADAISHWLGRPVIGGTFTNAGSQHAPNVAAWDGAQWLPLGDGPGFAPTALAAVDPAYESLIHYLLLTGTHTTPAGAGAYFTSRDTFDGPVHTNGTLRFYGNPVFRDRVTSVGATAVFYNNGTPLTLDADRNGAIDVPRFAWGFDRGSPPVTLPADAVAQQWAVLGLAPLILPPSNIQIRVRLGLSFSNDPPPDGVYLVQSAGAMTGGVYVQGALTRLELAADSATAAQVLRFTRGATVTTITFDPLGATTTLRVGAGTPQVLTGLPNGVVFVNGAVSDLRGPDRVGGIAPPAIAVHARLMLAATADIVIQRDLTVQQYATGGAVLGVLSGGGSVRVGTAAPDDLALDAFVVAVGATSAFTVDAYDAGAPRGALHLRGGVVESYYGPFGTFTAGGTPVTGYTRDFHHDTRGIVPPSFPVVLPPGDARGLYATAARPAGTVGLATAVSRWDDIRWTTLASGDGDAVVAYASHDVLHVGGAFTSLGGASAAGMARFDGVAWKPLGTGLPGGTVRAFAEYGGYLVAGGTLPALGHVAAWDGAAWVALGAGPGFEVRALRAAGGALYAAGGSGAGGGIARWDGAAWTTLAGADSVRALGALLAGPVATFGAPVRPQRWNGAAWDAAPDSVAFDARAFVAFGDTVLHAAGAGRIGAAPGVLFSSSGGDWSSAQEPWAPTMNGLHGVATRALAWGDTLVVIGALDAAAAGDHWTPLADVACWDGSRWAALGALAAPRCLAALGGALAAGDGAGAAWWDGAAWQRLGDGIGPVDALAQHQGAPVAAGAIGLGGEPRVMRLEGAAWAPLGAAFAASDRPLALWADDGSVYGELFVGGALTLAGATPVAGIARWDGAAWVPVGTGVSGIVETIVRLGADVVAGGSLSAAGASTVHGAARWDGAAWSPLGDNAIRVRALRVLDDALYATGTFIAPDSSRVEGLARWTGGTWLPLGSGVEGTALDLAPLGGSLFVVGDFGWADGRASANVARFDGIPALDVPRAEAPAALALAAPRPNPARGAFTVALALPRAGRVRLDLLDVAGRRVATLVDGERAAGSHALVLTPRGPDGRVMRPGLYLLRAESGGERRVRRLVLLD